MLRKRLFGLGLLACVLSGVVSSTIPILAFASEDSEMVELKPDVKEDNTFTSETPTPVLDGFTESNSEISKISSYEDFTSGDEVKTVLGENDVVLATEINKTESGEIISVVNSGDTIIIQKSVLLEDGTYNVTTETSPVLNGSSADGQGGTDRNSVARIYYAPWSYTNLAVGRNVFATIVDMGLGSWVGYFASLFRISRAAADFVFGYMGARGISAGERLARVFDSNGNGWVALYKRGVYNYKGAPLIGYQHRTF
ncbi:hypothetical protein [Enterococcus rotai]|uniref:hypothetical protein n=1 Tax=Enterococcus rotai TaxID=118060 RepID=UPI0035C68048